MAYQDDIALMAHLMRRAGFGAGRDELEARVAKGYEATVEELLHPETQPPVDEYTLMRYQPAALLPGGQPPMGNVNWMYHLVNTKRPLEEKMALFWHHVFATGNSKVDNYDQLLTQIKLFRDKGMGNYRDLLLDVAKNPTMIFWLDNQQNHGNAVNENWGRELLELFSIGAGNYTETDVRECSRAFTGWTFATKIPRAPYGRFPWQFEYRPEDHDDGEKEFLGHKGRLQRRRHHRHRGAAAGLRPVHLPASVQLLRRRRAAGAGLADRSAARSRRRSTHWWARSVIRSSTCAPFCACCSTRTSSRTPASST